jgi:hypothetical protein
LVAGSASLALGAAGLGVAALERALGGVGTVPRVLDGLVGAAAVVGATGVTGLRLGTRLATPVVEFVAHPPLVPDSLQPGTVWDEWADRGWRIRRDAEWEVSQLVEAALPSIVDQVLHRVDLTRIVLENVDIDKILVAVDLPKVAEYVVDEIDLSAIIRDSTSSVTSEAVRGVRMQSVDADQAVSRLADRLVHRRQRKTDAEGSGSDSRDVSET